MNQNIKNTGIFFGCVLALYYILVDVVAFFYDPTLFTKTSFGIFNMVVVVIMGVLCVWIAKERMQNLITFKEGFSAFLLMICIGFLANQTMIYVLFNFVRPEYKEINNQLMLDLLYNNLTALGMLKEEIEGQMQLAKETDNFALKSLLFSFAGSILRGSIAGLLIALIFKNKNEFETPKTVQ